MGGGTFTDWHSLIHESLDMAGTKLNASWLTIIHSITFAEGHCASVAAAEVCDCAWYHRCCLVEFTDAVWMAFIEWAWWPGRITGDDKDCPARLTIYLTNRRLNWNCPARMTRFELGRIPSSWLRQEMSSRMARPVGGGGRSANEWIVVSIGFQMN